MTIKELKALHNKSSLRKYIENSKDCACFYCLKHFKPGEIKEWVGVKGDDAICPKCGIDAVLSDKMCKLNTSLLKAMNSYWFSYSSKIKV